MRENIEYCKEQITKEIIKTDLENKNNGYESLLKMTKVDYLKRLIKLLKIIEK